MGACRNCGADLLGRFCHACGQQAVGSVVSVHDLLHEGFHEFAHLDGKIFQTLKLLVTRPGALTVEFFEGRRARYISPLRLYLTCSLLFFALSAMSPSQNRGIRITETDVHSEAERKAAELAVATLLDMRERITHNTPRSMFVLMPAFALLTWVSYRRAQPFYVPHLYYSIHFHAFVFLMFAVADAFSFGGRIAETVGDLFRLTIFPYHYLALRRVFGGTRWQTTWKGTVVAAAYLLMIGGALAALLALAVRNAIRAPGALHLP